MITFHKLFFAKYEKVAGFKSFRGCGAHLTCVLNIFVIEKEITPWQMSK